MIFNFCAVCGSTKNLYNHHWVPRSQGGPDSETNLITLCGRCHAAIHDGFAINSKGLIKTALDHKRERGERLGGGIKYGWMVVDHKMVPNLEEQETVNAVIRLNATGHSLSEIAAVLSLQGRVTRKGTTMSRAQVYRILKDNKGE